jgi:hypothetical protein
MGSGDQRPCRPTSPRLPLERQNTVPELGGG